MVGVVVDLNHDRIGAGATAARAIGVTLSRMRSVRRCSDRQTSFAWIAGIALMSMVLRVAVSNVQCPFAQDHLLVAPGKIYWADISHSSMVADNPRFNMIGFADFRVL